MPSPSEAFLAALPEGAALTNSGALATTLAHHCEAGAAAWPMVKLAPDRFAAFLAGKVKKNEDPLDALAAMNAPGLWLACGCVAGNALALSLFEKRYLREIDQQLVKAGFARPLAEEIRQRLSEKLLVAHPDQPAKIADYAGRGDLAGWVRVAAMRYALQGVRDGAREVALGDEALMALPAGDEDPELAHLKGAFREDFRAAFVASLTALSARERNLLRHQFVDKMSVEQMGALYGVHKATAARWAARARDRLVEDTKKRLREKLRTSPSEVNRIIELVRSRLDVSVRRFLGAGDEKDDEKA
jgi:RNA polymerase sigma-70 factor (ECF subfamily)